MTRYGVYKRDFKSIRSLLRTIYVDLYFSINDYLSEQKRLEQRLSSYDINDCKYCTLIDLYAASNIPFNKVNHRECSWYSDTVNLPFFDFMVPAPKEYQKLLTCLYGDYMTPVRGGELHRIVCFDSNRSYKEVIAELNKK